MILVSGVHYNLVFDNLKVISTISLLPITIQFTHSLCPFYFFKKMTFLILPNIENIMKIKHFTQFINKTVLMKWIVLNASISKKEWNKLSIQLKMLEKE